MANVARHIQAHDTPAKPARFVVTLSPAWYAYELHKILYERNTPFMVNKSLVKDLQKKELRNFLTKQHESHGDDFKLLESVVLDTKVNGYQTENPIGKRAKNLYMSMYLSVTPQSLVSTIKDVIGSVFHQEDITFQTSSLVTYVTSRDYFVKENDYIFVDVGGELTDIAVVKDHVFVASLSFPLGNQFFYAQISKALNTSMYEARSLIASHKKGALSKQESARMKKVLAEVLDSYEKHIHMALAKLREEYKLPDTIYTTGYGVLTKDVDDLLRAESIGQHNAIEKPFIVKPLAAEKIHSRLKYQKDVQRDLFIAMSALYLNHITY
jgi:hypothetical protein